MNRAVKTGVYTYNGVEKTFNFYTALRTIEKLNFITFITNVVVGDNYYPAVRDMLFDFELIDVMTDIDVSNIKNSADVISAIEDFLENTNIVEIIKANAEDGLVEELNKAVDDNIEYRTGIHKNYLADGFSDLLRTIERKIADIDIDFDSMKKMAEVFSGVSGELTADKMLEAYSKSDMFKQRYAQILSDKASRDAKIEDVVKNDVKIKNVK